MTKQSIAVIGGDGTGPEVVAESIKVLTAISKRFSIDFVFEEFNFGARRYFETGTVLTDEDVNQLKSYNAMLLGAIGHPDAPPGLLERGILLKLRFDLDQYINLRPVKLYPNVHSPIVGVSPDDIDYIVVRENTGGLYVGRGGQVDKGTPNEIATQEMVYTYDQVHRCLTYAFELAQKRPRKKLTLCGKSNVLTYIFDLWDRVFNDLSNQYPDVQTDYVHVDAVCIYMIEDPSRFDVIVTTNMFGDIITDLAATTQGGMGVAPGANINPHGVSMFEPIGGTAPLFTGLNQINPLASIGSAALMLAHLGYDEAAQCVEQAIRRTTPKMTSMLAGKMGHSTQDIGDMVVDAL